MNTAPQACWEPKTAELAVHDYLSTPHDISLMIFQIIYSRLNAAGGLHHDLISLVIIVLVFIFILELHSYADVIVQCVGCGIGTCPHDRSAS